MLAHQQRSVFRATSKEPCCGPEGSAVRRRSRVLTETIEHSEAQMALRSKACIARLACRGVSKFVRYAHECSRAASSALQVGSRTIRTDVE